MNDRRHIENKKLDKSTSRAANLILEIGRAMEDTHFRFSRPGLVVKFGVDGARDFLRREEQMLRRQELKRLERRGLIVTEKIANEYWTSFSKKGFEEYLVQISLCANRLPGNQMCIVSFDIPETQKRLRDHVRFLLRKLGFVQVHRSVWSCSKNVGDYIANLLSSKFKGKKWFKVYLANEL